MVYDWSRPSAGDWGGDAGRQGKPYSGRGLFAMRAYVNVSIILKAEDWKSDIGDLFHRYQVQFFGRVFPVVWICWGPRRDGVHEGMESGGNKGQEGRTCSSCPIPYLAAETYHSSRDFIFSCSRLWYLVLWYRGRRRAYSSCFDMQSWSTSFLRWNIVYFSLSRALLGCCRAQTRSYDADTDNMCMSVMLCLFKFEPTADIGPARSRRIGL